MNFVIHSTSLALASTLVVNADAASTGQFRLDQTALHGQSIFQWQDIDALLTIDENADGRLTESELQASEQLLVEFGAMLYSLKQADAPVSSPRTSVALTAEGEIIFDLTFALPIAATSDELELELEFVGASDFPLTHQHAFHVSDAEGKVIVDEVSDRSDELPLFPEVGHEFHAILDAADNQSPVNAQPVPLAPMEMRVQVSDPAQSQSRLLTGIWIGLALIAGWSAHFIMAKIRSRS